jgi:hypothetical protein
VVTWPNRSHAGSDIAHDTGTLVTENGGQRGHQITRHDVKIRVADSGCGQLDAHLTRTRVLHIHITDFQLLTGLEKYCCSGFHFVFCLIASGRDCPSSFGFDPDGLGLFSNNLSYKLLSDYSFLYSIPDLAGLKLATHFFDLPCAPEPIH